jgi:hypothetical protein
MTPTVPIVQGSPCDECDDMKGECVRPDGPCDDFRLCGEIGKLADDVAIGISRVRHISLAARADLARDCADALDNTLWELGDFNRACHLNYQEFFRRVGAKAGA